MKTDKTNNDKFLLKVEYVPRHIVEKYNMEFGPQVTIVGNKAGLKYLVDKITDYLESGDCDYDNLNFDIGPDLSDGSLFMDIVCDDESEN